MVTFQIPLLRSKVIVQAKIREKESLDELKAEISTQILQAHANIDNLKKQVEESKIEQNCKGHCEVIQKLIALHPTRSETHKLMTDLEKEIATLNADDTGSHTLLELHKKQVALFLFVVCLWSTFLLLMVCLFPTNSAK